MYEWEKMRKKGMRNEGVGDSKAQTPDAKNS